MTTKQFTIIIFTLVLVSTCIFSNLSNHIFAHTFSGDESAEFLATLEMIKVEAHLAQQNLASNITLAQEHADATTEHLDTTQIKEITERNKRVFNELNDSLFDLKTALNSKTLPSSLDINQKVDNIDAFLEVSSVRIDKNQRNNVTVKALIINDLVGETLEHYGEATGHEENANSSEYSFNGNLTNSVFMDLSKSKMTTNSIIPITENSSSLVTIVDVAAYQTAQALSSRIGELYQDLNSNVSNSTGVKSIVIELEDLKKNIDKKIPFDVLDQFIDNNITASLNSTFNLKLKIEYS